MVAEESRGERPSLEALVRELAEQDPKVRPGMEVALSLMDRLDEAIKKDGDPGGVGALGKIVCLSLIHQSTLDSRINRLETELLRLSTARLPETGEQKDDNPPDR